MLSSLSFEIMMMAISGSCHYHHLGWWLSLLSFTVVMVVPVVEEVCC